MKTTTTIVAVLTALLFSFTTHAGTPTQRAASAPSTQPRAAQLLRADEAHDQVRPRERDEPAAAYHLSPTDAFDLDVSDLTFKVPANLAKEGVKGPNSIQIVLSNDGGNFSHTWNKTAGVQRITGFGLNPNANSGAFGGFRAGQTVIIAIGYLRPLRPDASMTFYPFWVGMAEVR